MRFYAQTKTSSRQSQFEKTLLWGAGDEQYKKVIADRLKKVTTFYTQMTMIQITTAITPDCNKNWVLGERDEDFKEYMEMDAEPFNTIIFFVQNPRIPMDFVNWKIF